jgi:PleD family two-component response regulator
MEDYIDSVDELTPQIIENVEKFLEAIKEYADLSIDQEKISTSDVVRKLPKKQSEIVAEVPATAKTSEGHQKEVLLVIREKTAGLLFERELKKTGMHVTIAHDSIQAFGLSVRMKPDIVFISGVIDVLDGIDLACALKAMPYTKSTPICLLTSFDRGHAELKELPESVWLLHKNKMKDDLPVLIQKMAA